MKKIGFGLILPFLWIGTAFGQDVAYEKFVLPNGLQVILHEDHSLPVACVNIWYYVGAKDQSEGRSGFAHLFEHLMFMGTERVPKSDFDKLLEEAGGWSNASTSPDRTNYFIYGPRELLPTILWLEADRMEDLGRAMTQEKLDTQRDIVRNERREGLEMEPYGEAEYELSRYAHPPGHPYHLDVIGRHEDLEAATLQDVKDFFATYYVPNNASLVVAGDFDPAEVKPLIEKLFASIPRGAEPARRPASPATLDSERRFTLNDDVQFAKVYIAYHSPAYFRAGDAEMDLVADILSSGKSSRLYKRLVYEDKLATDVSASQYSRYLGSIFLIEATARQGVPLDAIEKAIDEELGRFVADGPSEEELRRNLTAWEYRMLSSLQSILGKADRMNLYSFYWNEPNSFRRDLDRYRGAKLADVRKWSSEVLRPDARVVLRVLPEGETPLRAARNEPPAPGAPKPFALEEPRVFALSNGIEVRHWERRELPLVEASLYLRAGSAEMDGARSGAASLVATMLDEGAGDLGALELSDSLDLLGASLRPFARYEYSGVRLSSLKRNLGGALGLMADAVERPRFEEKEWERVRRLRAEDIRRAMDRPATVASRVGARAYFGADHPYGRPVDGLLEDVEAITLAEVRTLYERFYGPANATLLVAGDLSKEEARDLLEKEFGGWKGASSFANAEPAGRRDAAGDAFRVVIVDEPGAVQTLIRFYMPGPLSTDSERIRHELVNTVLGGGFTSRLNANLRETHGWTYGAGSRLSISPATGYLYASSDVQAEVTGEALAEFLKEFERIRGGDIDEGEARMARESLRMETIQGFEGLNGLLCGGENCLRQGLPYESIEEDLMKLGSSAAADLNATAPRTIRSDRALLLLLGDKGTIEKEIEGLGLPAPEEWSAEGERLGAVK
ncbi:MAG: insulinase family protein [Candidatus Latescibacterota bacterium]|nr:MAG: insulinase family protein [Candidatus Latescibacterota bacterium]